MGPRESLRMILKPHYEIKTADSARGALDQLPEFRPDLVVLDIKMPEIDGLEVLRRIKRIDPTIEVVMITAYASLETVKLALSHGAFEYLIKPFSRQDLEQVVRRAVERRQADQGTRGQVARLVEEMRSLSAKTRELEEAARREPAEQSLRVTQLSILREMSRTIVGQLDLREMTAAVTDQLRRALDYDAVSIIDGPPAPEGPAVVVCAIRDAGGSLGHLVVDNRASGRPIDRSERELLEMLAEYLAVAIRNSRLYTEIATTKRSLEQLIDSAGDAIIPVDGDDRVEGWNPAAERIFGLSAADAVGRAITTLLPVSDYADAKRRLSGGTPMHAFEVSVPRDNGRPAALAVTLSALGDPQGAVTGLIAIVRDITVQREIEGQLNQAEKLTALGQLAGGIAHDFNNLLQAILGYSQLMKQNIGDADLVSRSLQVLESVAMDGSETVRRIQQFARLRPDEEFVPVDVNKIVHDAVVVVRDTGVGMPPSVRRRIFEPFFSTKGEGGSGLGLAMAYSIVKRHGGEIRVESESGRGTTFTLTFPGAAQISEPSEAPDSTAPRRIARVLVIDDDPQVLATLSELLRSLGHRVTAAPSGPAALAGYARDRFDVVLTNVGMAGMNGWEFAERLRAVDRQVALLFITGWGLREEDNPRLSALKVQRCLFKPIPPPDLDAAIQGALHSA